MSEEEEDYGEDYDEGGVPETPVEVPTETGRRLMQQLNPMQQRAAEQKRKEEAGGGHVVGRIYCATRVS